MSWSIVVPVKRLAHAKSRLYAAGERRLPERSTLVLALALDTVAAAIATPSVERVVVVTDERQAAETLRELGAITVPDRPDAGLNPALSFGATMASAIAPDSGVAVLASDLPALRPDELDDALRAAAGNDRALVSDAAGIGTALLAVAAGLPLDPRYGGDSRDAHVASGAVELIGAWPSLRRDVDTPADLAEAEALGVGPATKAAIATV
jgi:2-phospho-L-lactate/phosphoenolpyruvate guanylyltransferase